MAWARVRTGVTGAGAGPRLRLAAASRIAGVAAIIWIAGACTDDVPLLEVPDFDRSALEGSVRTSLEIAEAEFQRVRAEGASGPRLGKAYGELAMTYHAQDLITPAEIAYTNAAGLAPGDERWPYLLAHLYADSGRTAEAMAAFESTLEIAAGYAPASVYLGQLYLHNGDTVSARALFDAVQSNPQARAAARTGLGKVALAERRYERAAALLEDVLQQVPQATRLYQPLAMAYRGMGEEHKAGESLARYSPQGLEPAVPDPIVDAMADKVAVLSVLLRRGQRAGRAGRFDLAEQAFRKAAEFAPDNAGALANLGISLANLGRTAEARRWLTRATEIGGVEASVHLNLGLVLDRQGLDEAAAVQYRATLGAEPDNLSALVYLADARMRAGATAEAIDLYRRAVAVSPQTLRIRLSLAMAYVRARRYARARDVLQVAADGQPGSYDVMNALARVLATAASDEVRDGERALEIATDLFARTRSPIVGQTYAMALAQAGRFDEAITLQRETIIAYRRLGNERVQPFLESNLRLYESRRAAREGWPADAPEFHPRSPAARRLDAAADQ